MPNKTLDQVRGRTALQTKKKVDSGDLDVSGAQGGLILKDISHRLINHGLLATAADAFGNAGRRNIFDEIAIHLADPEIALLPQSAADLNGLVQHYTADADSSKLRRATAETMAWLDYARRFIPAGKN